MCPEVNLSGEGSLNSTDSPVTFPLSQQERGPGGEAALFLETSLRSALFPLLSPT